MQQMPIATRSEAGSRHGRTGLGAGRHGLGTVRYQNATALATRSQDPEPHSMSASAQAATPITSTKIKSMRANKLKWMALFGSPNNTGVSSPLSPKLRRWLVYLYLVPVVGWFSAAPTEAQTPLRELSEASRLQDRLRKLCGWQLGHFRHERRRVQPGEPDADTNGARALPAGLAATARRYVSCRTWAKAGIRSAASM